MEQTTAPEGVAAVESETEWTVLRKQSANSWVELTYDTQDAAVTAYLADPECALLSRVETTYYLDPENAADAAKHMAAGEPWQ